MTILKGVLTRTCRDRSKAIIHQENKTAFLSERVSTMNENAAKAIAQDLGGEPKQISNDNWHVMIRHENGRLVIISDLAVWEYADEQAYQDGQADKTIPLVTTNRRWR